TPGCTTPCQEELFLETQVGSGRYSEHFVAAYHHMELGTLLPAGTQVGAGQTLALAGTTGCSSNVHLDFQVHRLTNVVGGRAWAFQPLCSDGLTYATGALCPGNGGGANASRYGSNGLQGEIDPFGWSAPQGMDPLATMVFGPGYPNGLWDPEYADVDNG